MQSTELNYNIFQLLLTITIILKFYFYCRPVVSAGCGFSVLAILLCFIGTILDGVFYGITHNLDTCYERQTNTVYGDTSYLLAAEACVVGHSQDCMCVSGDDTDECYLFNLKGADDCGLILTTLPDNLLTSMFFLLLLLFLLFTYSVFTCMIVCVEPDRDVYIQDNNNGPAQSSNPPVATAAAAAAYPSYVQTQTPAVAKAYVQPPVLKAEPAPQPPAPQPTAVTSNPINNYGYV